MEVALDANSRLALRGLAADYKPIELVANPWGDSPYLLNVLMLLINIFVPIQKLEALFRWG
jgi:hypothetical protein